MELESGLQNKNVHQLIDAVNTRIEDWIASLQNLHHSEDDSNRHLQFLVSESLHRPMRSCTCTILHVSWVVKDQACETKSRVQREDFDGCQHNEQQIRTTFSIFENFPIFRCGIRQRRARPERSRTGKT